MSLRLGSPQALTTNEEQPSTIGLINSTHNLLPMVFHKKLIMVSGQSGHQPSYWPTHQFVFVLGIYQDHINKNSVYVSLTDYKPQYPEIPTDIVLIFQSRFFLLSFS